MGPQGFKDMDKRRFHVNDIADVIEWFIYRETRDQEALKVIKSLRNSHNTQASMIKAYQRRDLVNAERMAAAESTPMAAGAPGTIQQVDNTSESAKDEAIVSELQEMIDAEREAAQEEEVVELTDEEGDIKDHEYSVFFVKGTPRFKKGNIMVKSADVPEAIKEALLQEKQGGEV